MKCKYYEYDPVDGEWCKLHRTFFCNFSICKDKKKTE